MKEIPSRHDIKKFYIKKKNTKWNSVVQDDMINILSNILHISFDKSFGTYDILFGKAIVVINEMISNFEKYEDEIHFLFGVVYEKNILGISFKFPGHRLDINKVLDNIEAIETGREEKYRYGRGFYYCKQNSDYFNIREINDGDFTKELNIKIDLEKMCEEGEC